MINFVSTLRINNPTTITKFMHIEFSVLFFEVHVNVTLNNVSVESSCSDDLLLYFP